MTQETLKPRPLAPNGKPSKLTESQWHHVRTPEFKAWFGDWERFAKKIQPVRLELDGWEGTKEQLRILAQGWYSENLQGKKPVINADMDVPIVFTSEGKSTAFATSGNVRVGWKAEIVRALPELISRAIKVKETQPDERRGRDSKAFHTLVAPLMVKGAVYSAKITVREALERHASPSHKFYDIASLEINNGPEVPGLKDSSRNLNPLPAPSEPLFISVRDLASAVKGIDVNTSQVVDPETGEPMVVHHGTNAIFDSFRMTSGELGQGAYFTDDHSWAKEFGARIYSCFVNLRNPLMLTGGYGEEIDQYGNAFNPDALGDNDGILHQQSESAPFEIVATNPHQIQSATDNNGDFDANNPRDQIDEDDDSEDFAVHYPCNTA